MRARITLTVGYDTTFEGEKTAQQIAKAIAKDGALTWVPNVEIGDQDIQSRVTVRDLESGDEASQDMGGAPMNRIGDHPGP